MHNDPKQIMEEGWKARENLDFEKAEELLTQALGMFEEVQDWYNVTEALNHLAYNEKLKAVHNILKGLEYANKSQMISEKYSTKKAGALRCLISLQSIAGLFEQALKTGIACVNETTKPLPKSDILSHVATFQLRTGDLVSAEETINEAEELMTKHFEEEGEPHRSIWKSRLLATKGLILYNKNDKAGAKRYFTEALELAEKNNLKTRIEEIKMLIKLVD